MNPDFIIPDWPAPANIRALCTTRHGGVGTGAYGGLNLGDHVGDDPLTVTRNRALLRAHLPADPLWLKQVHGIAVAAADGAVAFTGTQDPSPSFPLLLDRNSQALRKWPVKGLPTSFVIDKQGRVALRAVGGRDFDSTSVAAQLRSLLDEMQ